MNMKEARIKKGFTQQQLADKIFVCRQTLSQIELGRNLPSLPLAKTICDELECTWEIFFTEDKKKEGKIHE